MFGFRINGKPHGCGSFEIKDSKFIMLLTQVWWCIAFLRLIFLHVTMVLNLGTYIVAGANPSLGKEGFLLRYLLIKFPLHLH